jgi:integrase
MARWLTCRDYRREYPQRCPDYPHKADRGIQHDPTRTDCYRVFLWKGGYRKAKGFTSLKAAWDYRDEENTSISKTRKLTTHTLLKDLRVGDVIKSYYNQLRPEGEIDWVMQAAAAFNKDAGMEKKRQEYNSKEFYLRTFLQKETAICKMPVLDFTRRKVKEYLKRRLGSEFRRQGWVEAKPLTLSALKREISPLSSAFELLKDDYPFFVNPFTGCFKNLDLEGVEVSSRKGGRPLEEGEIEKILDACKTCQGMNKYWLPLAIFIAYETGMRRSEILDLRDGDIEPGFIHIRHEKIGKKLGMRK